MRRIHKRKNEEIYRRSIIISIVFLIFIIGGTYINTFLSSNKADIYSLIEPIKTYYGSDIDIKQFILSNLSKDAGIMISIMFFTLCIVTFPIAIIIFLLKAMSIGYTINSCILGMQLSSIKSILVIIFKNLIIIPACILIILLSWNYFQECVAELNKKNKDKILSHIKRYVASILMIVIASCAIQGIVNFISITILQFFN